MLSFGIQLATKVSSVFVLYLAGSRCFAGCLSSAACGGPEAETPHRSRLRAAALCVIRCLIVDDNTQNKNYINDHIGNTIASNLIKRITTTKM